jgi:cell division septum initiation protein DivIVA
MAVAPVEIRHVKLKRSLIGGFRRGPVEGLLEEIAQSYEDVWREREDLRDRVEHLDNELRSHRELESLFRETLLSAEKSATKVKEHARSEAELVLREAHSAARSITQEALVEREKLLGEATRVRALLQAALTSVETAEPAPVETSAHAA